MADIPVNASDAVVIVDVITNGQTVFNYDFRADLAGDLRAIYRQGATTVEMVGGVDFTVSGLKNPTGGAISLTSFTATIAGATVTIYRDTVINRLTDFTRDLFADPLNAEFDKAYMIMQELARALNETLRVDPGETPPSISEVIALIEEALEIVADVTGTYARDGSRPLTGPLTTAGNRIVDLGHVGSAADPNIEFGDGVGIYSAAASSISFAFAGVHVGRFSETGIHVNKLAADITTVGHSLNLGGLAQHTRNGDLALQVNRLGAGAGTIAEFMKANAAVVRVNELGLEIVPNGSATDTNIRFGFGAGHGIYSLANTNVSFAIGGVHVGRFSSTGIHVTKFATDITVVGHSLTNEGLIQSTRASDIVSQFNRITTTGRVTEFLYNGVAVAYVDTSGDINARRVNADIILAQATTAELAAIGNAINTAGKFYGKLVLNTTINKIVIANGAGAGATWRNCHDGSTAHTPV